MAFTPTTGGAYIGTPRPGRRPYTRAQLGPPRPPDVRDAAVAVRRGLHPLSNPQGPSRPPDVRDAAAAAAQAPPQVHQAAQAANTLGAQADYLEQYLAGITDPKERAFVAAQIGPKIAALRAQQAALAQQAQQEQAAIQGLTAAMLEQLKGLAAGVGDPYSKIANIQIGGGKASGEGMAGVGGDVHGENKAILNAIGAPDAQQKALANLDKSIFTGGGTVLAGTGGSVPAFATQAEGIGALGWAAAQPTLAAAYAQDTLRQLMAQEARDQAAAAAGYGDIPGDVASARSDYAGQQADAQKAAEERATSLYNSGMISQRQYAQALGLPNWQSYPNTLKSSGAAHVIRYTDPATGRTMVYNPDTGRAMALPGQGVRPTKTTAPKPPDTFGTAATGYYTWEQTKTGWRPVQVIPPVKAAPRTTRTKSGTVTWTPGTIKTVPLPNGNSVTMVQTGPNSWEIRAGAGARSDPTKPVIVGPGGAPLTPTQINKAGTSVNSSITNALRSGVPIQQVIDRLNAEGVPPEIWMPIVRRRYAIPRVIHIDQLKNMETQRLYRIAAFLGYRPPTRRGKTGGVIPTGHANEADLIAYIQSHLPKAKAATETAATVADYTKWVETPPGIDRSGAKTHPGILAFAARVAQVWGSPLTVGTGTNHNQFVKGTDHESAHWTGWAVDIPMQGTNLTRLGQDALIAAGMPEAQARKVTSWSGGDYNGYNILFNTNVGGNHYNHLHIGLKPSRQQDPASFVSKSSVSVDQARTPSGARDAAQAMAKGFGWSGNEWLALNSLWYNESKWNYQIHNKEGSGAVGIPQYMPSAHGPPPGDFLTNPITQIRWGLNYIKTRYRTPSRAWAFWQATVNRNAASAPPDLRRTAAEWIRNGWAGY